MNKNSEKTTNIDSKDWSVSVLVIESIEELSTTANCIYPYFIVLTYY